MPTSSLRHRPDGTRAGDERRFGPNPDPSSGRGIASGGRGCARDRDHGDRPQTQRTPAGPPISISAFSEADLREKATPATSRTSCARCRACPSPGAELGQSRYSIRGISTTSPSPTVGIYLDDISLLSATNAFSGAADPVFFDFSRVEILKGPQGTLYGGSAMGGAIKYVSHAPELGATTLDTAAGDRAPRRHGGISYNGERGAQPAAVGPSSPCAPVCSIDATPAMWTISPTAPSSTCGPAPPRPPAALTRRSRGRR